MMVTFLNNLPSFDKDNFSNFQPDLNQYAQQTKKQHSYVIGTTIERGGDDCSSSPLSDACDMRDHAQLIVNQRCNLIIQYLDKQSRDDYDDDDEDTEDENHDELCGHSHMFNLAANSANEKNRKKRDIREVLDTNPESFGGSSSKTSRDGEIDTTSSSNPHTSSSSKYSKKRRTSIQNYESNVAQSSSTASTSGAGNNNESIEPIEVDNPNENVDF